MKKLLLGIFLVFSMQSFSQNNFRELTWGSSISQLKSTYPDVQWKIETQEGIKIYITEDHVGGLKVEVAYFFIENKLQIGGYLFKEEHSSNNMYYENFKSISNILNKKYTMEINEKWNNTTWKDEPNDIGFALSLGHVIIEEKYEDEYKTIVHSISSDNYGGIEHLLMYSNMDFVKLMRASELEDF